MTGILMIVAGTILGMVMAVRWWGRSGERRERKGAKSG